MNNQVDKSTETKTVTNNEVKSEVAAAKAETTKTETAKVSDNKVATTELQLAKATTNNNQKQVAANTLKMQLPVQQLLDLMIKLKMLLILVALLTH